MAGLLQNRSIPSTLHCLVHAGIYGQQHECECGCLVRAKIESSPKCPECGKVMFPVWDVRNSRGRVMGQVCGATQADAIESARRSAAFDKLNSFTVTHRS